MIAVNAINVIHSSTATAVSIPLIYRLKGLRTAKACPAIVESEFHPHYLPYMWTRDVSYRPVWLQPMDASDIGRREIIETILASKPLSHQDITTYTRLQFWPTHLVYRPNAVGLIHLLQHDWLPPGDEWDVVLYHAVIPSNSVLCLFGVWADSRGAAERFIELNNLQGEVAKHLLTVP